MYSDAVLPVAVMNWQLSNGVMPGRRLAEADALSQALSSSHMSGDAIGSFIDGLISEVANFSSFAQEDLNSFNFSAWEP